MDIMVFLHGTAIMHSSAAGRPREERVEQVVAGDPSVCDFASYVPVGDAVSKLRAWRERGARIVYLSSHTEAAGVELDERVLAQHGFPKGRIYFRDKGRSYADVVRAVLPDVLVEDDCESIGGEPEMVHPHLDPDTNTRVKSIVVKEFGGVDYLPDDPASLLAVACK